MSKQNQWNGEQAKSGGELENQYGPEEEPCKASSVPVLPPGTGACSPQALNERLEEEISKRKAAEAALLESERRWELALSGAELGVWDWNLATGEVSFNARWAEMLGFSLEEIEPHVNAEEALIHPGDKAIHDNVMEAHLNGKTPYFECEHRLKCKTGEWIWVLDRGKIVERDDNGKPLRVAGIHVDVTERRRMEESLREASKMQAIGALAGGISHDFNNILLTISGFTELALDRVSDESPVQAHLDQVLKAADRARELVNQIATVSRRKEPQWKPIEVEPIVKEVVKFLQPAIPASITLEVEAEPNLARIIGDPNQIHQVLMNLCTNAAQAIGLNGGVLKIELTQGLMEASQRALSHDSQPRPCLTVRVSDTGRGIPAEIVDRVFEPYFTTKPLGEGSGLGLAIVHGIVKNHDGTLTVKSRTGRGTEFKIDIPIAPPRDARPECGSNCSDNICFNGSTEVIFVDDEPSITHLCELILSDLGLRVKTCDSGNSALELFQEHPDRFDLLITDLSMPSMHGLELARRVKDIRPDLPIILCTGYAHSITEESLDKIGIDTLLHKPILKMELAKSIHETLTNANSALGK